VFFSDLRILELGPDSAAHYARNYRSDNRSGILLFVTSFGLATAGYVVGMNDILSTDNNDDRIVPALGLLAAAMGTSFWGSRKMVNAQIALSRSVWWYNAGMIGAERPGPGLHQQSALESAHYTVGGAALSGVRLNATIKVRLPASAH
jgi:hypothetical protein